MYNQGVRRVLRKEAANSQIKIKLKRKESRKNLIDKLPNLCICLHIHKIKKVKYMYFFEKNKF